MLDNDVVVLDYSHELHELYIAAVLPWSRAQTFTAFDTFFAANISSAGQVAIYHAKASPALPHKFHSPVPPFPFHFEVVDQFNIWINPPDHPHTNTFSSTNFMKAVLANAVSFYDTYDEHGMPTKYIWITVLAATHERFCVGFEVSDPDHVSAKKISTIDGVLYRRPDIYLAVEDAVFIPRVPSTTMASTGIEKGTSVKHGAADGKIQQIPAFVMVRTLEESASEGRFCHATMKLNTGVNTQTECMWAVLTPDITPYMCFECPSHQVRSQISEEILHPSTNKGGIIYNMYSNNMEITQQDNGTFHAKDPVDYSKEESLEVPFDRFEIISWVLSRCFCLDAQGMPTEMYATMDCSGNVYLIDFGAHLRGDDTLIDTVGCDDLIPVVEQSASFSMVRSFLCYSLEHVVPTVDVIIELYKP